MPRDGVATGSLTGSTERHDLRQLIKAVLIHEAEKQVEHLYQNIRLTHDERVQLEQYLREEIALASTEQRERVTQLKATADDLKNQQRKLLQLHYQDAIPADLLKEEQDRLGAELARIKRELEGATADHDTLLTNLSDTLTLAEDCDQLYKSAPEHIKRQLNQVFYEVVRINPDEHGQLHVQGELAEPFNQLLNPALRLHAAHASSQRTIPTNAKRPTPKGEPLTHEPENREPNLTGIFHASDFTPGSMVDLAEGLSKLAPPVIQMLRAHQSIRARKHRTHRRRHQPQQAPRASADLLQRAEAAYAAGGSLKAVARQVGLGHERLSRLLREGGVVLRNHSPSISEIRLMRSMYEQGASLERVGNKFGYTAGTVRKHLIAAGVMMRDTHGRV